MTTLSPEQVAARLLVLERAKADAAASTGSDEEAAAAAQKIRNIALRMKAGQWRPYRWQHPHVHPPGWRSQYQQGEGESARFAGVCDDRCYDLPAAVIETHGAWLELGGRGTGKTEGAAHFINRHAESPPCDPRVPGGHRFTIVAPTQDDAVASCVTGVSGLQAINPDIMLTTTREGTTVRWPNGAVGRILGAHSTRDLDRFRAWSNICVCWIEEAAAMRYLGGLAGQEGATQGVIDLLPFTLRLGDRPHSVITTTPKRDPQVQKVLANPKYVRTKGRTRDATRLNPTVRESLEETFAGTTLGSQELDAEELREVPGALWVYDRPPMVDGVPNKDERPGVNNDRVESGTIGWRSHRDDTPSIPGRLVERVVVGVDPAGGRTETGIVVVGTIGGHSYTLADLSTAGPPDTWAKLAIAAYYDFGAEGLAAEKTFGGDMVADVIHSRDAGIPLLKVSTKVGKRLRAEPVQALSQQHRVHMVGRHPLLENELTGWVPDETKESPNRLDAWVHAQTYLLVRSQATQSAVARGVIQRPPRRA
jgi:phage terminase large subunit-like protein